MGRRGAHGRVFLASQLSLGDRPVVLKLGPLDPLTLPAGQIVLAGQNNGGTVGIPATGAVVKPLSTQVSLGGTAIDVTDNLTLRSITAYRQLDTDDFIAIDAPR